MNVMDGTMVSCLLCRPGDNKMTLSILRDIHLPNFHFRMTEGKVDDNLNEYQANFISSLVELCLTASNLPPGVDVDKMIGDIVLIPNFNEVVNLEKQFENIQIKFHSCKLCDFMSNTNGSMREHCSEVHIEDENEKKDEDKLKNMFSLCFPDAPYSIPTPFTWNEFSEEEIS